MKTREHAKLSASGAHRWLACPRSVALEEQLEDRESEYSREGTEAHALAEKLLNIFKNEGRTEFTKEELGDNRDMAMAVLRYVEYVAQLYASLSVICDYRDTEMFIEERVSYERYVPEGFGTCDCIIIAHNVLHVIDYKHGRGIRVDAEENPQVRLYALGAIESFGWIYPLEFVHIHIVQPRRDHISDELLYVSELVKWGEDEVKPKALLAYEDKGDFVPGEHCRFCRAKAVCKPRAMESLNVVQDILKNIGGN